MVSSEVTHFRTMDWLVLMKFNQIWVRGKSLSSVARTHNAVFKVHLTKYGLVGND